MNLERIYEKQGQVLTGKGVIAVPIKARIRALDQKPARALRELPLLFRWRAFLRAARSSAESADERQLARGHLRGVDQALHASECSRSAPFLAHGRHDEIAAGRGQDQRLDHSPAQP